MPRKLDLLIVDGDPYLARKTAQQLGRHSTRVAFSAEEALQAIAERAPAVLVCDYFLGSGPKIALELLRHVERHHPETRRVVYTASRDPVIKALLHHGLAHALVEKPATPEQLLSAVEAV